MSKLVVIGATGNIGSRVLDEALRRGHKVADKGIKGSSPEEVTGLITGAIRAA